MRFCTLIIMFLASLAAEAQTHWGIRGGANLNSIHLEYAPFLPNRYFENNYAFHLGGFVETNINKKGALHTGFQFIQMRVNSRNFNNNPATSTRINLNLIEAPVLLVMGLSNRLLSIEIGPSFLYRLSASENPNDLSKNLDQIFSNKLEAGMNGGIRFLAANRIAIWSRYYHGFKQASNFPITSSYKPQHVKTNFQVGLGYILPPYN
ncbi:MAG: PorT family protein [Cyclobacteriaceae bacterium]|nr:PorT family protein [Cyclobacteriaceae bacterium]